MIVFHHREDGGCGGTLVTHIQPSNPESMLVRFTLLSLVREQLDVSTIYLSFFFKMYFDFYAHLLTMFHAKLAVEE